MKPPNGEPRLPRRIRRIAVVLLTDTDHLTAPTIAQAAQVTKARTRLLLSRMEFRELVTSSTEGRTDGQASYRLTREGLSWAHRNLRLPPRLDTEAYIRGAFRALMDGDEERARSAVACVDADQLPRIQEAAGVLSLLALRVRGGS